MPGWSISADNIVNIYLLLGGIPIFAPTKTKIEILQKQNKPIKNRIEILQKQFLSIKEKTGKHRPR